MIEATGNLWEHPAQFRVITTNGAVRKDGACVMGRGCALEAKQRFPKLPYELGELIKTAGNNVHLLNPYDILSFPVKHRWNQPADLALIERSAHQLRHYMGLTGGHYVMPRPGCGNGQRTWDEVRPILDTVFPEGSIIGDKLTVITFGE